MDLAARIAAEKAALKAAEEAITPEDKAEIDARAELEKLSEKRRAAEQQRRDLDLIRRFDAARDTLGADARIEQLSIVGWPDTFIVQYMPKSHAKWLRGIENSAVNKKVDRDDVYRDYAVACVIDWNGITDFDDSEHGAALNAYLRHNPGLVRPICDAAVRLAGAVAEERKS